jgi:hypothetical protein
MYSISLLADQYVILDLKNIIYLFTKHEHFFEVFYLPQLFSKFTLSLIEFYCLLCRLVIVRFTLSTMHVECWQFFFFKIKSEMCSTLYSWQKSNNSLTAEEKQTLYATTLFEKLLFWTRSESCLWVIFHSKLHTLLFREEKHFSLTQAEPQRGGARGVQRATPSLSCDGITRTSRGRACAMSYFLAWADDWIFACGPCVYRRICAYVLRVLKNPCVRVVVCESMRCVRMWKWGKPIRGF